MRFAEDEIRRAGRSLCRDGHDPRGGPLTGRSPEDAKVSPAVERRIDRELETVRVMIAIYCRGNHGDRRSPCTDCLALWEYAQQRVGRCPFRADKPTCVNCPVHCFKPAMREQIRLVMRHAGPRMFWRHPIMSLFHLLDGRRQRPSKSED